MNEDMIDNNDIIRIKSVVDLMKSIVINVEEVANFFNVQHNFYNGDDISEDKTTWQYYLNMAGLKHKSNKDIKMVSLDNSEEIILTTEILETHTITKQELLLYEDVFDYVNNDNGGQELYLRGILNPIPLEVSTTAENYEVLYLDPKYHAERESTLRSNITYALQAFIHRWYMLEYEFENRYVPTIYSQLLSVASLEILNTRLNSIHTERASDLDIHEHMNSNIHTADILDYVDDDVKIWLYVNMRRIVRNVSKDATLQELLINVLKPSGISLHDIVYETPVVDMSSNGSDVTIVPWTNKASLKLVNRDPDTIEEIVSSISEREYLTLQANTTNLDYNNIMIESLKSSRKTFDYPNTMKTKSIYLSKNTNAETVELESTIILLENWIHDVYRGIEHSSRVITMGNLGEIRISSTIAVKFLLAILFKEFKLENEINGFRTENVIVERDFSNVITFTNNREVNIEAELNNIIPDKLPSYSSDTYHEYMKDVFNFHTNLWIIKSSVREEINMTNLQILERRMFGINTNKSTIFDMNSTGTVNFEKELLALGYNIDFDEPFNVIDNIMSAFTGYSFRTDSSQMLDVFMGFVQKLISYNIQILKSLEIEKQNTYLRTTNLIRGLDVGYINGLELYPIGEERLAVDVTYFLDDEPQFLSSLSCTYRENAIEDNIHFKIEETCFKGELHEADDITFLHDDGHMVWSHKVYPGLKPFVFNSINLPTVVEFVEDSFDDVRPIMCRVKMVTGSGGLDRIVFEDDDQVIQYNRCTFTPARTLNMTVDMSMTRNENNLILNIHNHRSVLKHGKNIEDVYFDSYFIDTFLHRNTTMTMTNNTKAVTFEEGHSVAETIVNDSQFNMDMLSGPLTWNNGGNTVDVNDDVEMYITDYPTTLTGSFSDSDSEVFFMEDTNIITSTLPTNSARQYGMQNIMVLSENETTISDGAISDDMIVSNTELTNTLDDVNMDDVSFDDDGGVYSVIP
jgi:hypothetical protein